jgi:hypothetical protein
MGVQVTRINDRVERFPEADGWQHDDRSNSLLVTKGEHVIAIFAPGQWSYVADDREVHPSPGSIGA